MSRLPVIPPDVVGRAQEGALDAINEIIVRLQPGLFNLAVRMLGHREDARDACQEILLKVITHLGGFRGEAAFGTWAYQIARNHLLRASTRAREVPEVSFEAFRERLAQGLALAQGAASLTPQDKAAAREVAIDCTQGMTMVLDREHRLAWLLDVVFGLLGRGRGGPAGHARRPSATPVTRAPQPGWVHGTPGAALSANAPRAGASGKCGRCAWPGCPQASSCWINANARRRSAAFEPWCG